jgi:copper chaperone
MVPAEPAERQMERMELKIEGMSCGHCVGAVRQALTGLRGVEVASLSVGRAEVAYDPATTDVPAILAAIGDAGYPARATTDAP